MKRGFVLHHNGPPANCLGQPHTRCVAFWNAVKAYHQQKWPNSNDIAYSFGVCPHGTRFVGRGWDRNQYAGGDDIVGADDGPDSAWFSVLVFLGGDDSTHDTERPTSAMVQGVIDLIDEGRRTGRCERRVLPHSAFKPKPCPGPEFTAYAHAWDNQPLPTAQPLEDDMTPVECRAVVRDELAKHRTALSPILGRTAAAIVTGQPNQVANPKVDGWGWVGESPPSLALVLAAVAGVEVDEATIATALAPVLLPALVAGLQEAASLTVEEAEAAAEAAMRRVLADAGTPG